MEHDYANAARSLEEGLGECFTIHRLEVHPSQHRYPATSNIEDKPNSGLRSRTRRVRRGRPGIPTSWSTAACLENEKYRKILRYLDLWALKAILDGSQPAIRQAVTQIDNDHEPPSPAFRCVQDTVSGSTDFNSAGRVPATGVAAGLEPLPVGALRRQQLLVYRDFWRRIDRPFEGPPSATP